MLADDDSRFHFFSLAAILGQGILKCVFPMTCSMLQQDRRDRSTLATKGFAGPCCCYNPFITRNSADKQ
jgi:hypothetical protein